MSPKLSWLKFSFWWCWHWCWWCWWCWRWWQWRWWCWWCWRWWITSGDVDAGDVGAGDVDAAWCCCCWCWPARRREAWTCLSALQPSSQSFVVLPADNLLVTIIHRQLIDNKYFSLYETIVYLGNSHLFELFLCEVQHLLVAQTHHLQRQLLSFHIS